MDIQEMKQEITKEIRENLKKDVRIIIFEFTEKQDEKNNSSFADKEVETVVKWIIRIVTGGVIAFMVTSTIASIMKFL